MVSRLVPEIGCRSQERTIGFDTQSGAIFGQGPPTMQTIVLSHCHGTIQLLLNSFTQVQMCKTGSIAYLANKWNFGRDSTNQFRSTITGSDCELLFGMVSCTLCISPAATLTVGVCVPLHGGRKRTLGRF